MRVCRVQNKTFSLMPPVIVDTAPAGKSFGSVWTDVQPQYSVNQTVSVTFVGANPRNNLMTGATFLTVEQLVGGNSWKVVVADADWSTKFYWSRRGTVSESYCTITWDVPANQAPGTYRIGTCVGLCPLRCCLCLIPGSIDCCRPLWLL
jgi:neutral ceramidase